jgi:hypothetical protein
MGQAFDWGSNMMGGGWVGGLLTFLLGALIVVGIVALVIWVVRASRQK